MADFGNLAVEPTRAVRLDCPACGATWGGCSAVPECPACGTCVDYTKDALTWLREEMTKDPDHA